MLEAGVQTSWMKQQTHTQNLANLETPGYKSKQLEFSTVLEKTQSGDSLSSLDVNLVTDDALSLRPDGNNVDFEKENLELYKSYTQYSMFINKVNGQFENYNYVLNNTMK